MSDEPNLFEPATRWAGKPVPPVPSRHCGPILHSAEPVRCRGDALGRIWWQGRTWAVTADGIERRDGLYAITADRLGGHGDRWCEHICRKGTDADGMGYDREDFRTAYLIACALHGIPVPRHVLEDVAG